MNLSLCKCERKSAIEAVTKQLKKSRQWGEVVKEIRWHELNDNRPCKRTYHERAAVKREAHRWMEEFTNKHPENWLQEEISSEVKKIEKAVVARARYAARR